MDKVEQKSDQPYSTVLHGTHINQGDATLKLNACHVPSTLPDSCPKSKSPLGYILIPDGSGADTCYLLSHNTDSPTDRTLWAFAPISPPPTPSSLLTTVMDSVKDKVNRILALAPSSDHKHVQIIGSPDGITLTGTNLTKTLSLPYNISITMNCAPKNTGITNLAALYKGSTKTYEISFTHQNACGYDLFGWWNKIGDYKYAVGGIAAVLCAAMAIFGWKLFKPSLALIGFISGVLLTYIVLNMFWDNYDDSNRVWIFIGIGVVVGLVFALTLFYCLKLAVFGCGGFLGVTIGFELYEMVIYKLEGGQNNVWLYVTVIGLGVVCALLALWLEQPIIILSTAWGGSYVCVKCIGVMCGNYPDETMISEEIAAGELDGLPKWGYIYLGIMIVMAIACTIFQCVKSRQEEKDKKEKEQQGGGYQNVDFQPNAPGKNHM